MVEKELLTLAPARWTLCPFRHNETECHARPSEICKCNPEPGRSWPRRCYLTDHDVLVKKALGS